MSETSSSGAGSTSTTAATITNEQIQAIFPGITFVDSAYAYTYENPEPGDPKPPTPPDNFWESVGWFIADEIVRWVFKKFGWLLIIEAIEPAEPND